MRLYVAGPIAGVRDRNPQFEAVTKVLSDHHYDVVNPKEVPACDPLSSIPCALLFPSEGREHTWQCGLRHDLRALLACDGLALLRGWSRSRGAKLEFEVAQAVGMKCWPWDHWLEEVGVNVDAAIEAEAFDASLLRTHPLERDAALHNGQTVTEASPL